MAKVIASLFALISFICLACNSNSQQKSKPSTTLNTTALKRVDKKKLHQVAKQAKFYCKAKNLNTSYCYIIDLSLHSGIKRFFVWDFKKDTITQSFMVSHGCYKNAWGKDYSKEKAIVSNENDSHCSSIGKYIIGERGVSQWGIKVKYNLYGQDSSNSNAFKRQIVLHSWDDVTNQETFPNGTVEGWGCPAVSNSTMQVLDKQLRSAKSKVLLYVVD